MLYACTLRIVFTGCVIGLSLSVQSCKEPLGEVKDPAPVGSETTSNPADLEIAFPGKRGIVKTGYLFGSPVTYEEIEGQAVFQGDMLLSEDMLSSESPNGRTSATGRNMLAYRWPNNTVYYRIDPALPNPARVTQAIAHWEEATNLKFVNNPNASHRIVFMPGAGCSSAVGMQAQEQSIILGPDCTKGTVIHEIGHAVGLFHEHSRTDRDNHLVIKWNNIKSDQAIRDQFKKWAEFGYNGFDHSNFDFGSVMLYGSYSSKAAIDPSKPVITTTSGNTYEAQREGLSQADINCINDMYPASPTFDPIAGKAREIVAGADGSIYKVGTVNAPGGYIISKWTGSSWQDIDPDQGGVHVAVMPNGQPWLCTAGGYIYRLVNNQWKQVPGQAVDLAINSIGSVFRLGTELAPGGHKIFKWNENTATWTAIGGNKGGNQIAAFSNNVIVIVDSQYQPFLYNGVEWLPLGKQVHDISISPDNKLFMLEKWEKNLYKWNGNSWTLQPGAGESLCATTLERIWLTDANNNISRRGYIYPIPYPL
ncbi:M12 family metallopeptidase [Xanthocytophaga agilis]|nr:M12 family metallopeptidase [Xanthocytophaga agilis]